MKTIYFLLLIIVSSCSAQNENTKLENELLKLKNQAFCDCYYKATESEKIAYNDGSSYVQIINLKDEYIYGNQNYRNMINQWLQKEYKSFDPKNNLYLMKCLDFYNSKELEKFIDSVRQNELQLMKNN